MDNPPSIIITPIAAPIAMEYMKLTFRNLYIRRSSAPDCEISMDGKGSLGKRYFSDFPIYDGPGSDAKLVARAQGFTTQTGQAHQVFTIVFEIERFKGSTLLYNGVITGGSDEWAIYGGTGEFRMASGVIKRKYVVDRNDGNSDELTMEVFCPILSGSQKSSTKIGLWGGKEGSEHDITEAPKRLESVTIRSDYSIDSIEFSYVDKSGERRTAGPWGGPDGTAHKIDLGASEFVKEVSGTYNMFRGETCLTSFKLTTNTRTWGPWAVEDGTRFTITAPTGTSIVGFYARGGKYLDAIGVYVREL
ncbi:hypothetical protein ACP70R_002535 [Stipagrostis hirtigluma subsp. patula]